MTESKKINFEQELYNKTKDEACLEVFNLSHDLVNALNRVKQENFPKMFKSTISFLCKEYVNPNNYEDFFESIHLDLIQFETQENIKKAEKLMKKNKHIRKRRH